MTKPARVCIDPLDLDGLRERPHHVPIVDGFRACADEIDRLRADVAAMLPIVEAVAEGCTEPAYMYRNGTPYQVLPRELCEAARRFLDARKVGP